MKKNYKKIKIKHKVEMLHHFQCAQCNGWWTIGDAQETKEEWWCPWCGYLQKIEK
jgi:transcription elongation factor Elf1